MPTCSGDSLSNYYVSALYGDDANDGSLGSPWATLSWASSRLEPGNTLYVREGVYNEQLKVPSSGTSDNWITYEAYEGETPIIDADGLTLSHFNGVVEMVGKSYIRIKGLTVKNGRTFQRNVAGIVARGNCHYIEILDNTISNMNCSGILCGMGYTSADELNSYITVRGNEIFDVNHRVSQEALTICNVDNFEVAYNHVHNTYKEGIDVKGSSSNGVVHHNKVHDLPGPGIYLDGNPIANVDVHSNYVYNLGSQGPSGEVETWPYFYNWMPGIALNSEPGSTIDYVNVYNNIVDNASYHSFTIGNSNKHESTRIRHVNVYNNTFERSPSAVGCNIVLPGAAYVEDINIFNNILWRRTPHDNWGKAIGFAGAIEDYTSLNIHHNLYEYFNVTYDSTGWIPGPFLGTDNVILAKGANVAFVNGEPVFGDVNTYRLKPDSLAIDAGASVDLKVDYFGNPRPSGSGIDIGAYESTFVDLPGDLNGDGVIDSNDSNLVRANWGKSASSPSQGDANGDGIVNIGDLDVVRANWGRTALTVPEPSIALLGLVAAISLARRKRDR